MGKMIAFLLVLACIARGSIAVSLRTRRRPKKSSREPEVVGAVNDEKGPDSIKAVKKSPRRISAMVCQKRRISILVFVIKRILLGRLSVER